MYSTTVDTFPESLVSPDLWGHFAILYLLPITNAAGCRTDASVAIFSKDSTCVGVAGCFTTMLNSSNDNRQYEGPL